jgi:hypothetical protein
LQALLLQGLLPSSFSLSLHSVKPASRTGKICVCCPVKLS